MGAGRKRAWSGSGLKKLAEKLRVVAHRWCETCAREVREPGRLRRWSTDHDPRRRAGLSSRQGAARRLGHSGPRAPVPPSRPILSIHPIGVCWRVGRTQKWFGSSVVRSPDQPDQPYRTSPYIPIHPYTYISQSRSSLACPGRMEAEPRGNSRCPSLLSVLPNEWINGCGGGFSCHPASSILLFAMTMTVPSPSKGTGAPHTAHRAQAHSLNIAGVCADRPAVPYMAERKVSAFPSTWATTSESN